MHTHIYFIWIYWKYRKWKVLYIIHILFIFFGIFCLKYHYRVGFYALWLWFRINAVHSSARTNKDLKTIKNVNWFSKLNKNLNKNKNLPIIIYLTQKNLMNDLIPRNQNLTIQFIRPWPLQEIFIWFKCVIYLVPSLLNKMKWWEKEKTQFIL